MLNPSIGNVADVSTWDCRRTIILNTLRRYKRWANRNPNGQWPVRAFIRGRSMAGHFVLAPDSTEMALLFATTTRPMDKILRRKQNSFAAFPC